MNSIQTKLIALMLAILLFSGFVYFLVSFYNSNETLNADSDDILMLTGDSGRLEMNDNFMSIEQAVNSVYNFAIQNSTRMPQFLTDSVVRREYTSQIAELSKSISENTKGAMAVYMRYNPNDFDSKAGFWYTKYSKDSDWTYLTPTDISMYDEDDIEHVGWYYLPIKAKKPVWMDPYFNKNLGIEMISYIIPVYRGDYTVGIIGMDIDLDLLREEVSKIRAYNTGTAMLVDDMGNLIYHVDYPDGVHYDKADDSIRSVIDKIKISPTGTVWEYEYKGTKMKVVTECLQNGMKLAISVPQKEIGAPGYRLFVNFLSVLTFVLVVSILASIAWIRSITRPLKELTYAADQFAKGNLDTRIDIDSKDEVGVLASSFRKTALALKEQIDYINGLALTDGLTRINNKTAYNNMEKALDKDIASHNASYSIVVMDVNNLKKVNDTYGHEAGDALIQHVSECIRSVFGSRNVFRIGGDEFVAVLRGNTMEDAQRKMELLDVVVEDRNHYAGEEEYLKTVSVASGAAEYIKEDEKFADTFKRADEAMYLDKVSKKKASNI